MRKNRSWGAVVDAASSMKTGLCLFALVAISGMGGSLDPRAATFVYRSWWFATLLAALVLNTTLCTVRRRPGLPRGERRPSPRGISVFATHVAVILLAIAALLAVLRFGTATIFVEAGETFRVEGQELKLLETRVEHYANGAVSDWLAYVSTPDGPKEIKLNHPARIGSTRILLARQSAVAHLDLVDAGGMRQRMAVEEGALLPLDPEGTRGLLLSASDPASGQASALRLSLISGRQGREEWKGEAKPGVPLAIADTAYTLTITSINPACGFILRRTPGIGFLWASLIVLSAAITGIVIFPEPRRPSASKKENAS